MATTIQSRSDDSNLFKRRVDILSEAKLKDKDRIISAIKIQDAIRAKSGHWNGSKEIRRIRGLCFSP